MTIDIENHNIKMICADKNNHFSILKDNIYHIKLISKQYLHFST